METRIAAKRLAAGLLETDAHQMFEHPASKLLREEEIVSLKMIHCAWGIDKQQAHPTFTPTGTQSGSAGTSITLRRTAPSGQVAQRLGVLPTWMLEFAMSGGMAKVGIRRQKRRCQSCFRSTRRQGRTSGAGAAGWTGGVTRTSIGLAPRVAEDRDIATGGGFRQPKG